MFNISYVISLKVSSIYTYITNSFYHVNILNAFNSEECLDILSIYADNYIIVFNDVL